MLQPFAEIAFAASDKSFALESRDTIFVALLLVRAFAERHDLRDRGIAILDHHSAAGADMIEVARKAVADSPIFAFFMIYHLSQVGAVRIFAPLIAMR